MNNRRSIRTAAILAAAIAAAGSISQAGAAQAASAAPVATGAVSTIVPAKTPAALCYVWVDWARYYFWTETGGTGLSWVSRGQGFTLYEYIKIEPYGWYGYGKLWGGRDNVWIHTNDLASHDHPDAC